MSLYQPWRILGISAYCVLFLTAVTEATDVKTGHDLFVTGDGSSHDFSETPIPNDFFGPGSDPFTALVNLEGTPLGLFSGFEVGNTDTIVQRAEVAAVPDGTGESDTIAIELVALSLKSINPITVTFNGGQDPEPWDLSIDVSLALPSTGTMTITHANEAGGTYTASMCVYPLITFRQVNGTGELQLDAAELDPPYCAPLETAVPAPWTHAPDPDQMVVLGLTGDQTNQVGPPWDNDFYVQGEVQHDGPHPSVSPTPAEAACCLPDNSCAGITAQTCAVDKVGVALNVTCAELQAVGGCQAGIPTVSEWGLVALTLVLLAAGTIVLRRRSVASA